MPVRFLNVPHIQQKADADCLVACAAMMLEFANFHIPYNRLLKLLGTTDLGTPYSRLQLLSRVHSDILITYRPGEFEDLIYFIDQGYPVGIFVDTEELPYWQTPATHAVVVIGYSEQDFYLHDPAFSKTPQAVSHGDLLLAWDAMNSILAVVQRKQKPK